MQLKRRNWLGVFFVICTLHLNAQNNVVLEQIQSYSSILPKASYWRFNEQNSIPLIAALDSQFFPAIGMQQVKTFTPSFNALSNANQLGKIIVNWTKTAAIPYHAYLELYELEPELAYRNNLIEIDASKKDSILSIWFITCTILDQNKKIVLKKTALMSVLPSPSIGMGYQTVYNVSTENNLHTAITKAIVQLNPANADYTYIETHAPPMYALDNFILPYIHQVPRIPIDTNNKFISFTFNNQRAILRIPLASMQKINYKPKTGKAKGEFYEVAQPLRDVKHNIDYTLQTIMSYNPNTTYEENQSSLIQFVADSLNLIYQSDSLIGQFKLTENVPVKDKWINPNILFNGYDSTISLPTGNVFKPIALIAEKKIEGNYNNIPFSVLITNEGQLKTIYVLDQIAIIVQGKIAPTQMVIVQRDLSPAFLNFILLFTYSEIFQTPSNN